MAQLVVGAVSAAVGFAVAGPTGAQIGWAIGTAIAAPTQKVRSPRLDDLKVTGAEYGQPIPWVRGHPRVAGQLWWSSDKREVSTTTSVGKGGGVEQTTYTYQVDLLYGLTSSEIQGISRIWSNGKLIYSRLDGTTTDSLANSAGANSWDRITCYTGAADQLPDPTYEAAVGVGNAPAYRGRGTVFIEGLQLGSSGQIPNLTFEVFTSGTETPTCVTADEEVLLQLCFEGANNSTSFIDSSLYAHTVVQNGDSDIDTSDFACGTSSLYCGPAGGSASVDLDEFELSDFTIRLFFKAQVNNDRVYCARITATTHGWRLRYEPGGQRFIFTNYRVPFTGPGPNVFTKDWEYTGSSFDWHEIVLVVIAGDPALYVDGVLLAVTSDSGNAEITYVDTAVFCVGSERPGSTLPCKGWFDDVQVITRALTGDEITGECTSNIDIVVLDNDTLQETVETLCEKAGMPAGTYDATALASITKPIRALAVSQVTPARTVLEQLAAGYFFEAYASDKLYFVPRGGSVALSVPVADLGAGEDQATEEALPVTISSDEQIPAQIALTYSNVDSDYNTATEYSDRLISGIVDTRTVALPMGFTASEAKGISDAMLADEYASRVAGQAAMTLKYSRLVPTDVVTLTSPDGDQYRARLVRRTEGRVLVAYEWVVDDATAIESAGITSDDYTPSITVNLPGPTAIELMDIPILRDADNSPGIYVAAKPSRGTWPGYQLLQSIDGGVEYTDAGTGTSRAVFGETTTVLTTWTGGNVFDEKGSVTVDVGATLSSATRDDLLNSDANAMLIGDEVIQYRTATLVTTGIYTLTGLLRGRRGTEWAMASHAIGERAVLLRPAGLLRVGYDAARINIETIYKGVTLGKTLSSARPETIIDTGIALKPFAPTGLRVDTSTPGLYTVTWDRRTRLSYRWPSTTAVPLGEASETYEADLLDLTDAVIDTQTVTGAAVGFSTATRTTTLDEGIGYLNVISGAYYGIQAEGSGLRYVLKIDSAGTVSATSFSLGDVSWCLRLNGGQIFATGDVLSSGTPQTVLSSTIWKLDPADITAVAASYTMPTAGDAHGIWHDGTSLWVPGYVSGDLRELNGTTLASIGATLLEVGIWSITGDGTYLFITNIDTGDVFAYDPGVGEIWRVTPGSGPFDVLVRSGFVYVACADRVVVLNAADGTTVADHAAAILSGSFTPALVSFGSYVCFRRTSGYVAFINAGTGAIDFESSIPAMTYLSGADGSTLFTIASPTLSFTDYQTWGYELNATLSGFTVNVYQISATVGRGYPATITL